MWVDTSIPFLGGEVAVEEEELNFEEEATARTGFQLNRRHHPKQGCILLRMLCPGCLRPAAVGPCHWLWAA